MNNGYKNSDVSETVNNILDKWYNKENKNNNDGETMNLFYRNYMSSAYTTDENIIKDIIERNVHPTNPQDKIKLVIFYKTRKTPS